MKRRTKKKQREDEVVLWLSRIEKMLYNLGKSLQYLSQENREASNRLAYFQQRAAMDQMLHTPPSVTLLGKDAEAFLHAAKKRDDR